MLSIFIVQLPKTKVKKKYDIGFSREVIRILINCGQINLMI